MSGSRPPPPLAIQVQGKDHSFEQYYEIHESLGKGHFAVVHRCVRRDTREEFAVKIVDKAKCRPKDRERLVTEVEILRRVRHPNVVSLKEVIDLEDELYIVMELVTGGELFDRIVKKHHYTEKDASLVMKNIFEAVTYLHENGMVHRDLKPENILLSSDDDDASIKITDFGLSKLVGTTSMLTTPTGTPGYIAPEVLSRKGYDKGVDLWACGVIMYILLAGFPPFYSRDTKKLLEQIKRAHISFEHPVWSEVSDTAKDMIKQLLHKDVSVRLSAQQALRHPWIVDNNNDANLMRTIKPHLNEYNDSKRKFKVAVDTILASNRFLHGAQDRETELLAQGVANLALNDPK